MRTKKTEVIKHYEVRATVTDTNGHPAFRTVEVAAEKPQTGIRLAIDSLARRYKVKASNVEVTSLILQRSTRLQSERVYRIH